MKIGTVVIRTRTENTNVHIGSAIYKAGSALIMIDAVITPML
jgi:hypothetical protein